MSSNFSNVAIFDQILADLMELRESLLVLERESTIAMSAALPCENKSSKNMAATKKLESSAVQIQLPTHREIQRLKWLEEIVTVLFEFPKTAELYRHT